MAKEVKRLLPTPLFRKPIFWLVLSAILLGGAFRFYNPNWDFGHSFHPDERNILGQTSGIQPSTGYRVSFFAYGQLSVYLYRATGELLSTPQWLSGVFRGSEGTAQWVYWFLLAALLSAFSWFFSREKFKIPAFSGACFLFVITLFLKWFPVFWIWFGALEGKQSQAASLLFVAAASFALSGIYAKLFEAEWVGIPFYSACGAIFVLGVVPAILPEALKLPLAAGTTAFTLLITVAACWLAWVSRWGRVLLALLTLWTFFASQNHGGRQYVGYGECMVIGRIWAAFFSTLTIGATYLFVRRVYRDAWMAVLAASSFAFAAVSIEQAHYCITESLITLMLVVVALCSYEITKEGSWKNYLFAGAAFGLAMAAKTSALYYVFILVAAHLVLLSGKSRQAWEREDQKSPNKDLHSILAGILLVLMLGAFLGVGYKFKGVLADLFRLDPGLAKGLWAALFLVLAAMGFLFTFWGASEFKVLRAQMPQWIKLAGAGALSFLLFCLLSPWSLLDLRDFMGSMNYEWDTVAHADACYVYQFKDTPRYLFHLQNLMSVELWWPLGVTVVAGMAWVLGRFLLGLLRPVSRDYLLPLPFARNKGFSFSTADLLLLSWFIPYFGFIGSWNTKFIRYMVPLIPVFCIFGARFLSDIGRFIDSRFPAGRFLKSLGLTVVLGSSLFYSIAYMHVYRHPHPWIEASVWIYKNVPAGSMVLTEEWDDGLPTGVDPSQDPRVDRGHGPQEYRQKNIRIYETFGFPTDDTAVKKNDYVAKLQEADYISIASKKLWYTLTNSTPEFKPRGFNGYPVTSRYYRLLWSGLLGFKMVGEFHNFPSFLGWEHPDDMAEESFSVYDHPRVYLFKKVENVPADRILRMLGTDDYVRGVNRNLMRNITPATVDSFIAQRRKTLEERGLLKDREGATPVTQAATPPASAVKREAEPPPAEPKASKKQEVAAPVKPLTSPPSSDLKVSAPPTVPGPLDEKTRKVLQAYSERPVIEQEVSRSPQAPEEKAGYQWRAWFSWLAFLIALGWLALPWTLRLLAPLAPGAYSLSKVLGFFAFCWVVWFFNSLGLKWVRFTTGSCWFWFFLLALLSAYGFWRDHKGLRAHYSKWKKSWWIQEGAFTLAFAAFSLVKIHCPHIHDPSGEGYWGGGEAGMDFGFLSSVVRGETFPPQNMWMAGQPIGYPYYFGHLMMGILTKTLGLVPAVTYNLGLITLFALVFSGAFGLAFALSGRLSSGWLAGFFCAAAGNPAGAKQILDAIHRCFVSGSLGPLGETYDFFGPSRVIPHTINEFPYFSVLYGDMHSHTLAMPFAMLLIGIIASLFMSKSSLDPFRLKGDRLPYLVLVLSAGFLMGGMAFLNTWDVLTWGVLLVLALLIRSLSGFGPKVLVPGLGLFFAVLFVFLSLLNWALPLLHFLAPKVPIESQYLGGNSVFFGAFAGLGACAGTVLLFALKRTRPLGRVFVHLALFLILVAVATRVLWWPFFAGFVPQQSQVLWVVPRMMMDGAMKSLRSEIGDFFGIHGLFLCVLLLGFVPAYSKEILNWIGQKAKKARREDLFGRCLSLMKRLTAPQTAVPGMFALGLVTLAAIWEASWVHWNDPATSSDLLRGITTYLPPLFATGAAVLFVLAVGFKNAWLSWLLDAALFWVWTLALVVGGFHLYQDSPFTLSLGLFSILWLLAFLFLGASAKARRDGSLSFSYLLVSVFFFVVAGLEVFVMKEYLGGEWMRNNSYFKFGIHAWILASLAAGVFLPKILDFFRALLKAPQKEAASPRTALVAASGLVLFALLRMLLGNFLPSFQTPFIYIVDIVFTAAFWVWAFTEGWLEKLLPRVLATVAAVFLILFSALGLLSPEDPTGIFAIFHRWGEALSAFVSFPLVLTCMALAGGYALWYGRKDYGRRMFFQSWRALLAVLLAMTALYPPLASYRKAHGFLPSLRQKWVGYAESPTLNGLEFIGRDRPGEAAAMRFLNDHVPDQPCLAEFVGAGYNSWGSRFSIFTGLPALMGWDGHVHEWVEVRHQDDDIASRKSAEDLIFRTTDAGLAKKTLDAYGVRLVIVGMVERFGAASDRPGYPAAGLAKFSGFLPLIYKNPDVEIYYNPPAAN